MSHAPTAPEAATVPDSPYVGLAPFTEEHAAFFFGRDAERKMIVGNLRASRLTLLYAQSGVGKSSLLRGAVAPRLRELAERSLADRGSARYVAVVFSSWGGDPVAGLVGAIGDAISPFVVGTSDSPAESPELPADRLEEAIETAAQAVDSTLLLILDQFEEYFLYHPAEAREGTLADQLATCINRPDLRAQFLISIRDDAYSRVGGLFKSRVPNVYGNYLHLKPLDESGAREAIEKPIEHFNVLRDESQPFAIEPELVDAILDQVRRGLLEDGENGRRATDGRPRGEDAMGIEATYLQLVMKRLWDEERAVGSHVLRLETLERLGGAETIIRNHLRDAMAMLPDGHQDAAAAAFRFLVTPGGTKIALTVKDLSDLSERPESELDPVLRRLSASDLRVLRLVTAAGEPDAARYEIFHDALARPLLDWRSRHSQVQLVRAKELAEQQAREAQKREEHEKWRARRLRGLLIGAIVLLIGTAVAFALVQRNAAANKARLAQSILLAGRASDEPDPVVSALTALEAYRLSDTGEARGATLTQVQQNTAVPQLLTGHDFGVTDIAFTPDSKVLASGSSDGTVRLWDATSGDAIGELRLPFVEGKVPSVDSVAISPDGSLLAAAAAEGPRVRLWDVRDRRRPKRLPSLEPYENDANVVAFGGGRTPVLAAGGDDETITLWNLADPRKARRLPKIATDDTDDIEALAFAPGGRILASGDDFGDTRLWQVVPDGGARLLTTTPFTRDDVFAVSSLAFSPRGDVLVAGGKGSSAEESPLVVWDVSSPAAPRYLKAPAGHADTVFAVGFDGTGERAASGGTDGNVIVWDTESWRAFGPPRTHDYTLDIVGVELSPDGTIVASADDGGTIKLWAVAESRPLARRLGWSGREIWDIAVAPGGVVAAASGKAGIELWRPVRDPAEGPPPKPLVIEIEKGGTSYAVSTHGSLVVGAIGNTFGIWRLAGGRARQLDRSADEHSAWITELAVSPDGSTAASGSFGGKIVIWDISDPTQIRLVKRWKSHGGRTIEGLEFDPERPLLASSARDGTVRFWDVSDPKTPVEQLGDSGKPLVAHEGYSVYALAFNADGSLLASAGGDRRAGLWNVRDPSNVARVGRAFLHTGSILGLTFNPDGTILAVVDGESGVVLYDVTSRRPLGFGGVGHVGANASYEAVAFDDEETTLYTAGPLNPVVAWDSNLWTSDYETMHEDVCRIVRRDLTEEEWRETFRGTDLVGGYRRTCTE